MKSFFPILFIFCSCFIFSQKFGEYYVTNNNDTIKCDILKHSYERLIVLENGQKKKYKPHEIKLFSVFVGAPVKYVSLLNNKNQFYVERIKGKLSLYHIDDWDFYTKSIVLANVLVKDNKIIKLRSNTSNRNTISKLISDCPTVLEDWNNKEKYPTENIERVIESYNNCSKN
ncbi:hypothetical protein [Chryseobacterium salivictor]|uniref:Uncharacterized protein n=1 Tax=Chryseobacterium salivictor TaxID=2547600 RepID=A0A4P6ZGD6_9FLAO|nr:hypothetical protein [Chryseobacterium salivictor]QBO58740.1 hypothetical protein NBC122_01932 [Chryseobacterium salivictor]